MHTEQTDIETPLEIALLRKALYAHRGLIRSIKPDWADDPEIHKVMKEGMDIIVPRRVSDALVRETRANVFKDNPPPDAVFIGRGSRYENPFQDCAMEGDGGVALRLYMYDIMLHNRMVIPPPSGPLTVEDIKTELAGKKLYCDCNKPGCHAYFLFGLANYHLLPEDPYPDKRPKSS